MAEEKQQAEDTVQEPKAEPEKPQVEATKPMDFFVKLTYIQNELSVPKNQYNNYGKLSLPQRRGYPGSTETSFEEIQSCHEDN